ncbi:FAD linked oxidases, C-terminal domain containing protein, putative [Angomonas deanei]|uniref:FAD linked oxidases, C-terminal domain containing protein, putative n=1 Tax=Angomonas deanei TaxID=59799 RepID=A0A7G2CBT0_9TRYP|nr:FAD linked oxidases, C-terminal domain containing protein, putative [Angomonas deanei]
MLNRNGVSASNSHFKTKLVEDPTVLMEFVTNDPKRRDSKNDFNTVAKIFKAAGKPKSVKYLRDGKEMDTVWEARRGCFFSAAYSDKSKGMQYVIHTDVCVPLTALAQCITETEQDFESNKRPCIICAHISDGNFHALIPYCDSKDFIPAKQLEQNMVTRALKLGGTVSGEHGIGIGKVQHLVSEHGQAHIDTHKKRLRWR